jgi:hypothetical protein
VKPGGRFGLLAPVVVLAFVAGCTTGGGGASPTPSATELRPLPRPTSRPVNPDFDFGQDVQITTTAFVPKELVSAVNFPITWTNDSGHEQVIHFDNNGGIESGPIAPGATWSYTPTGTISIVYHSTVDASLRGRINVQPLSEP